MTTTIKNVIKKIKAKLNFHGVSDTDVLKVGNTAYNGLLNNPAFPNTPFPLTIFRQVLDSFSALIVDAEDGGKKSISAKDKQRAEVIRLYGLLGHYVEATCDNDPASFNASGFTAVSTTRTAPQQRNFAHSFAQIGIDTWSAAPTLTMSYVYNRPIRFLRCVITTEFRDESPSLVVKTLRVERQKDFLGRIVFVNVSSFHCQEDRFPRSC